MNMTNRRIRFGKFLLAAGLLCGAAVIVPMATSSATNPGVCEGTHLFPDSDVKTLEVTADDGKLISGYCIKAGSARQGDGPVYVVVDPPAKTVVISHPSGKDISHYTVTFVDEPDEETTTTVGETTTTVGEETTTTVGETTTTTVPEETTTTTVPDGSTTSTTVPDVTSTTLPEPEIDTPLVIVRKGAQPVPAEVDYTG